MTRAPRRRLRGFAAGAALLATVAAALVPASPALAGPKRGAANGGFDVVVLGATGGIADGDLSAYLVRPTGATAGVMCDAGALVNGIRAAERAHALDDIRVPADAGLSRVGWVLRDTIKGYLISHAHLDHVAGLVIASPEDAPKPIYALPSIESELLRSYFRAGPWSNFTDAGEPPRLGKYHMATLRPGEATPIAGTAMQVTPFPLAHGGTESTAFLIEHGRDAMLCFGDTGPDPVEHDDAMHRIWAAVADRVRERRLKAVIVEVSFPSDRPDDKLFGHLTPRWLLASLHELEALAGGRGSLKGLTVVVSHVKYALTREQPGARIMAELAAGNDLGVRFVLPHQGQRLTLR